MEHGAGSPGAVAAQTDPRVWSLLAPYEMGPWVASCGHERRKDVFGLNSPATLVPGTGVTPAPFAPPPGASSADVGNKLGLSYSFRNTDLLLMCENPWCKISAGAVSAYGRNASVASVLYRFSPHRAIASYQHLAVQQRIAAREAHSAPARRVIARCSSSVVFVQGVRTPGLERRALASRRRRPRAASQCA
ncbi:MAG: hypothetical protein AB1773_12995 [Pseudomonadota bacterium]